MKTRFLILLLLITSNIFAQQDISTVDSYYFYGVDFSNCIVNGADESEPDFINAFTSINELFYSESDKYTLKCFNRNVLDVNIEDTNERNMKARNFKKFTTKVNHMSDNDVDSIIKNIKVEHTDGYGMIILCECLDKTTSYGYFNIVFFDNANRNVIYMLHTMGEAGGFGLRNYWANSVHKILKKKYKF